MESRIFLLGSFLVLVSLGQFCDGIPVQNNGLRLDQNGLLIKLSPKIGEFLGNARSQLDCDICKAGVDLLRDFVARNLTNDEVIDIVTDICVTFDIEVEEVCRGMLDQVIPEIMYVFKELDFNVTSAENICGFIFMDECIVLDEYLQEYDWNVSFPSPEPPYVPPPIPDPDAPKLRILHITDIHMDPEYAEGTVANCDEPICCRTWSKTAENDTEINYSGHWGGGHFVCDLPQVTLENMLQYIVDNVEFDAVYWTGDVPPGDVWNQTKDSNLAVLRQVSAIIKQYIPDKVVYPAVGNHESDPVNSFPIPLVYDDWDISYLYNQLDETWGTFVPDLTDDSVLRGGYYWSRITPGLRVISLNMNYCNNENVWLLLDSEDPTGEFQWLIELLDEAERNDEKVHLIGHIPPGSSCTYVWSRNFRDVLDRYKGTISASFYGHTHHDEFQMVYDDVNVTMPIHVSNIGPSVTGANSQNPAFRVYTVDGDYEGSSYAVLDYEAYYMDVELANQEGTPTWQLMYTALDSYGLSEYSPEAWDDFVSRMETDDVLFQLFYWHYHRSSHWDPCYGDCKSGMLCRLRSGWSGFTYPTC